MWRGALAREIWPIDNIFTASMIDAELIQSNADRLRDLHAAVHATFRSRDKGWVKPAVALMNPMMSSHFLGLCA